MTIESKYEDLKLRFEILRAESVKIAAERDDYKRQAETATGLLQFTKAQLTESQHHITRALDQLAPHTQSETKKSPR